MNVRRLSIIAITGERLLHELGEAHTLSESEARYRVLFDTTLDGILLLNDAGQCVDANLTLLRYYLVKAAQALGRDELGEAKKSLASAKRAHQEAGAEISKLPATNDSRRLAARARIHGVNIDELEQQINRNDPGA